MAKHSGWLKRLTAVGVVASGAGHSSVALAAIVPPTNIGINLSRPDWFRQSRDFANLALGAKWTSRLPGHQQLSSDEIDQDGNVRQLPGGAPVFLMLTEPNAGSGSPTIKCTYDGKGDIRPTMSAAQDIRPGTGFFTFRWRITEFNASLVILKLGAVDAADPVRNLDCRETDMASTARFDPKFLDFVRNFKVIRFMDWQNTNTNLPVTWATRHTPRSVNITENDGVSVEDMVRLSAETGAAPWFNMPWNGDEDYITRFAQYVHDNLPRDRKVYVELSNEVWNYGFPASKQAYKEGTDAGLSSDFNQARMFRYAERVAQVMDIWSKIFADRPGQLVRVAAWQNTAFRANGVLGYKGTANHIDALATAPYFGGDFQHNPPADADAAFTRLNDLMDKSLDAALESKAVAAKYGKRYIAYEAGQHIILPDGPLAQGIQRDARMYDTYRRYLGIWRAKIGDTIMMFDSVQPIVKTGSWGLLEYLGQPTADAPKMRATLDAIHENAH